MFAHDQQKENLSGKMKTAKLIGILKVEYMHKTLILSTEILRSLEQTLIAAEMFKN